MIKAVITASGMHAKLVDVLRERMTVEVEAGVYISIYISTVNLPELDNSNVSAKLPTLWFQEHSQ